MGRHGLPSDLPTGSSSAYVTPGSGQIFRQFQGTETKAGGVFLVTDTGLRRPPVERRQRHRRPGHRHDGPSSARPEQQEAEIDAQAPRLRQHGTRPRSRRPGRRSCPPARDSPRPPRDSRRGS
ncbi:hypothetical protein [Streptomyces sp. KL116D]|uniref:hypothetical protein n=1 Tax=Streptomyces sp. KL116D TaxID=3045152 RepID=UPI0035566B2E